MNNKKNAGIITRFFATTWLLTLIMLVVSLLWEIGLGQIAQIGLIVFLLLSAIVFYAGGFFYLEFEVSKSKLIIKHYNLFPFWREFKVYQIPIDRYSKYQVKSYFGGLFSWIYIYEQTNRGLAKYPAIGTSALSATLLKSFTDYLESIKKNPE